MIHLHQDIFGRKHLRKMIENHLNSYTGAPSVKFYINAIHNYFRELDSVIYHSCMSVDAGKIHKLEHIASMNNKVDVKGLDLYVGSLMRTKFASMYMSKGKLRMCRLVDNTLRMPHDVYHIEKECDVPRIILKEMPRLITLASRLTGINPLLNRSAYYVTPNYIESEYGMVTIGQFQIRILRASKKNELEVRVEHMMTHAKFTDKLLEERTAITTNVLKALKLMPVIKDADLLIDNSRHASIFIELSNSKEDKVEHDLNKMYGDKIKLRDETKERIHELDIERDQLNSIYNDTVSWLIKADKIKSLTDELLRG